MAWFRRSKETAAQPAAPDAAAPDAAAPDAAAPDAAAPDAAAPDAAAAAAKADPAVPSAAAEVPKKKGFFAKLRQGLQRTSDLLRTDIRDLFTRKQGQLVDQWLDELYAILVRTDMGTGPAKEICDYVQAEFRARIVEIDELIAVVKRKFAELLAQEKVVLGRAATGPTVVLVVGVNGSGKTTSIAKLASYYKKQGLRVILGAGDTFRAAAVEQLTEWAKRLDVEIVTAPPQSDPASVAHRAVARALEGPFDVCIVDTAGRLQTQANLMDQLRKIHRVISKQIPDAPHEVFLVLDATAGQNGISQAQGFSEAAECTGIILAKLDGTAKGGVIIPIRKKFNLPVKFVGVGEKPDDLVIFQPADFVDGLFDQPPQR
jgi:fused signal recognition particle receptor